MELRKHPGMAYLGRPNWPPEWAGPYGPDNPLPRGEVGILIRVESASHFLRTPHCVVAMQYNQQEYFGVLYFGEEDFLQKIVDLLRNCIGQPVVEIGRLDVPQF